MARCGGVMAQSELAWMGNSLPPRLRTRREHTSEERARALAPTRMAAWTLLAEDMIWRGWSD